MRKTFNGMMLLLLVTAWLSSGPGYGRGVGGPGGAGRFLLPLVLGSGGQSVTVPWGATVTLQPVFLDGAGSIIDGGSNVVVASAVSGGSYPLGPITAAQSYTLKVTNLAGDTASSSVTVSVIGAGMGSISATASPLYGGTSTVTPVFSGGTAVVGTSQGASDLAVNPSSGVGIPSGPITGPTTFWIRVTDGGGNYVDSQSAVITPQSVVVAAITPNVSNVNATASLHFASSVTGAQDTGIVWSASGGVINASTGEWTAPTANTTVTITAASAANPLAVATLSVGVIMFTIDSFNPDTAVIPRGTSTTLRWTLSFPSPSTLTLDGQDVTGRLSALATPFARQTYTLTGRNGNTDTRTTTVAARGLELLAGSAGGIGTVDGTGSEAKFTSGIYGIAGDAAGTIYVTDNQSHTIRKIGVGGVVTTIAGEPYVSGFADGLGRAARFLRPASGVCDQDGNLFVLDTGNYVIRKITPGGDVTTFAGTVGVNGHADGSATSASFGVVNGIAIDNDRNLYVTDGHCVRKITAGGVVSTFAGTPLVYGSINGTGTAARFQWPTGLACDASGNVFVADSNNATIRMITPEGDVTNFAGQVGVSGHADGTGNEATFSNPQGLAFDNAGNLIVVDSGNQTLRTITPAGVVTTLAGSVGVSGHNDGTGGAATFWNPSVVACDPTGSMVVADSGNALVRKVTQAGVVTTYAGSTLVSGNSDGMGSAASFNSPQGLTCDAAGNVYVTDAGNRLIRKVTPAGAVTTFAGSGAIGRLDGQGTNASFKGLAGITIDAAGNLYVADSANYLVRKIDVTGYVSTLAGTGTAGYLDSDTGSLAQFRAMKGIACDGSGNIYVSDYGNRRIRKIAPNGAVSTLAGSGASGNADGVGTAATFNALNGLACDATGNVYVADQNGKVIRKIITDGSGIFGTVSTFAGNPLVSGSADGTGPDASFQSPMGIVFDKAGNLWVTDGGSQALRKITPSGAVTTELGDPSISSGFCPGLMRDGAPTPLDYKYGHLYFPGAIAISPSGDLYLINTQAILVVTAP